MSGSAIDRPAASRRKWIQILVLSVATMVALLMVGCKQSPTAEQVRLELEQQLPGAQFERESHIHLGRISMGAVKQVLRFTSPKGSIERQLIASLKRVDVATYRVVSPPDNPAPTSLSARSTGWSKPAGASSSKKELSTSGPG